MSVSLKKALKTKKRQAEKRKYKTLIKNQSKIIENECSKQNNLKQKEADFTNLKKLLSQTQKILDKSARKGIIRKNGAARKKSKISRRINDLEKKFKLDNSAPNSISVEE